MAVATMAEPITRQVTLRGIADLMFDRYAGDNKTQLDVAQKMYFAADGKSLVMPAANISSFLTAENTPSAPKRLLDKRQYKDVCQAILSYTSISPFEIPLTRDGKPIVFHGFTNDVDKKADIYVHRCVARLAKGIPNPKVRPVVRAPWELSFELTMYPNDDVNETMLNSLIVKGGIAIGLGTYRGVFGKFVVDKWE